MRSNGLNQIDVAVSDDFIWAVDSTSPINSLTVSGNIPLLSISHAVRQPTAEQHAFHYRQVILRGFVLIADMLGDYPVTQSGSKTNQSNLQLSNICVSTES